MNQEIIEMLKNKFIPDLLRIICDYNLTPYQYYELIDQKTYTSEEYEKFRNEYEVKLANDIHVDFIEKYSIKLNEINSDFIGQYSRKLNEINNDIDNEINKTFQMSNCLNRKPEKFQMKYQIKYKSLGLLYDIFCEYIKLLISALRDARVFNVIEFEESPKDTYVISGMQYFKYFYDDSIDKKLEIFNVYSIMDTTKVKLAIILHYGEYKIVVSSAQNKTYKSQLLGAYLSIVEHHINSKNEVLKKINKI